MPQAPAAFKVELFAVSLQHPRWIRTAPNGDLFVAESEPGNGQPGRVKVLRGIGADGKAQKVEVFAGDLKQPFGIAFCPAGKNPKYVYIGNTNSAVRYAYSNGDHYRVWGRPVGVATAQDGSLIVTDDGSSSVWRVTYAKEGWIKLSRSCAFTSGSPGATWFSLPRFIQLSSSPTRLNK